MKDLPTNAAQPQLTDGGCSSTGEHQCPERGPPRPRREGCIGKHPPQPCRGEDRPTHCAPRRSQYHCLCLWPTLTSRLTQAPWLHSWDGDLLQPEHTPPIKCLQAAVGILYSFLASTCRHPLLPPSSPSGCGEDFCSTHPSMVGSHPLLPKRKWLKRN